MSRSRSPVVVSLLSAAVLLVSFVAVPSAASGSSAAPVTIAGRDVPRAGHVSTGTPHVVTMSALPDLVPGPTTGATVDRSPLLLDGRHSNAVSRHTAATKPALPATVSATQPTRILQNFAGTGLANSSCGCQPPDSNAAMGKAQILEATNLQVSVFKKATTTSLIKRTSLATFLGTADSLSDPRVMYDNVWQRFFLTVIVIPANSSAAPAEWVAVSQTNQASGGWWIYRLTFGGGPYAPGTLMDYPMVGMDADSMIISTNLFNFSGNFVTGSVYALAKARIYNGLGLGVGAFNVDISSHPAFVEGIPQHQDGRLYVVSSRIPYGQTGFNVWYITNSSRPDSTTLTFQGTAADANGAGAPNRAIQPGSGSPTLDALDGRLQAAPHQLNGLVWFARAEGFPVIEYGSINESNLAVTSAIAFVAGSSYDWNPSIAVSDSGGSNPYLFLNWAYTNPSAGTNVSTQVAGLGPADVVQNLLGVGTTLATGGLSSFESRFGDYSSVQIDAFASGTCPAGRSALVANQQFDASGNWVMREARIGFC